MRYGFQLRAKLLHARFISRVGVADMSLGRGTSEIPDSPNREYEGRHRGYRARPESRGQP
jgi:hypothetical protein